MICSSLSQRPQVWANSSASELDVMSSSDRNVLQGDGHVSIGEHGVKDFRNPECRFVQSSLVNHRGQGSMGLTAYQGVLQKWDPLEVEIRCQNEAFQHP